MITLQAASLGVFEQLADYGILGIMTLGLGSAVWWLLRRQLKSEEELKSQVNTLQASLNNYVREDRDKLANAVVENSKALHDSVAKINEIKMLVETISRSVKKHD